VLTVELPDLPRVSALDGETFQSIVFCRFVSLSGSKRKLRQSQRQVLSMFNRSSQRVISKHFADAQAKGFLTRISQTRGADPDVYIRGDFFASDSQESRAMARLSNSLWGTKGLLRTLPFQTVWGHGCLSPATVLALSSLRVLDERISKKSLRKYLSPLVPESSFNAAMKFMIEKHLAILDDGWVRIAPDWETKLRFYLDKNPACNERFAKGELRRQMESNQNRVRLQMGKLSDAELKQLLSLPCVVQGCTTHKKKRRVQEHFPPKRFLKQLGVVTNRHFVWSICKDHNRDMADFIKKLEAPVSIPPTFLQLNPGVDPTRTYSAAANHGIQKFYKAYRKDDLASATDAVFLVIGLWKALSLLPEETAKKDDAPERTQREAKGQKPYSPHNSQLPR
jgi:hypothetical protein